MCELQPDRGRCSSLLTRHVEADHAEPNTCRNLHVNQRQRDGNPGPVF